MFHYEIAKKNKKKNNPRLFLEHASEVKAFLELIAEGRTP